MFRRVKRSIEGALQRSATRISFRRHLRKRPEDKSTSWVVGPVEIANLVPVITSSIPGARSAIVQRHAFYDSVYDFDFVALRPRWVRASLFNGWLFGKLAAHSHGMIYLGQNGFLGAQGDARDFEFSFLKARGLGVVCIFAGSDIRSPAVMAKLEQEMGLPNVATYLSELGSAFRTSAYEQAKKELAATADRYADAIFTAKIDQAGHLTSETEPFRYFFPEEQMVSSLAKFDGDGPPVVLHAPSSPILKGTQLVRAAVAALRDEGLKFEYVELIGVPHEQVWEELKRAHIVMNQFYAFLPGMFGIEAMSAGAVLLTSADERIETDLPAGSNRAWVVTRHHEVVDRLREVMLASRESLREQAERGQAWVRAHATERVSGQALRAVLAEVKPQSFD